MTYLRIGDAAALLSVSDDTVRRWLDTGKLEGAEDEHGRQIVSAISVAEVLAAGNRVVDSGLPQSARNRFPGIVTRVERDGVMALVEIQAGPHRVISLMSREAADELGLEPGMLAAATVKATNVVVDVA